MTASNGNGIPSIMAPWPAKDVSGRNTEADTALLMVIDCLCLHHGNSNDGGFLGMVPLAGSLPILPNKSIPKGRALEH